MTDAERQLQGSHSRAGWLSDYVYGTIATLVAMLGLTFEAHPNALSACGVIVVGALAIWMAHAVSELVGIRARHHQVLPWRLMVAEFRGSWSIVAAAAPGTFVMALAAFGLFRATTGLKLAEVVGVASLAVVGIGTAAVSGVSRWRQAFYVIAVTGVGVFIVLLEGAVHLL